VAIGLGLETRITVLPKLSSPRLLERSGTVIELDQAVSADLSRHSRTAGQSDGKTHCSEPGFRDPDPTLDSTRPEALHARI
jgi:hypothetical protein